MERERTPFDAPDAEELRDAEALGEALEGRSQSPHLPESALETAALLRFSGPHAQLGKERHAALRKSLLAGLPTRAAAPQRRWGWLALWLPAAVGASLAAVFAARSLLSPEQSLTATSSEATLERKALAEPEVAAEGAAAPAQKRGISAPAELAPEQLAELSAATRSFRAARIAPLADATLERIHAQIDAATTAGELDRAAQSLTDRYSAPSAQDIGRVGTPSDGETRLVRQDMFCRLAEASLRIGQPEQALEWAKRGLDLDGPPNPLLAELTAIDARARASMGDRLGAAKSYLKALEINETLLDENLDGP